jgi:hypothetical protein
MNYRHAKKPPPWRRKQGIRSARAAENPPFHKMTELQKQRDFNYTAKAASTQRFYRKLGRIRLGAP